MLDPHVTVVVVRAGRCLPTEYWLLTTDYWLLTTGYCVLAIH